MSEQQYGETVRSLSGAYALHALSPEEQDIFEKQLTFDEELLAEVTEFGDTAALLGLSVAPASPPPGLREKLLAQIETVPQLHGDKFKHGQAAPAAVKEATLKRRAAKPRRRLWWPVTALAGVGAAALLGIGVGIVPAVTAQSHPTSVIQALQRDDQHETAHLSSARGAMTMLWSDNVHHAAIRLSASALRLPNDSIYQLWVTDKAGKTVSAGLLRDNDHAWRVFGANIEKGDMLRMTVEPAGGSKQPTSDPLFTLSV